MQHHIFQENEKYKIAVLMKPSAFNPKELETHYVNPLNQRGVLTKDVVAFTLKYNESGKAPAGFIKDYLHFLLKGLDSLGTKYLYVTDAAYFKVLAGVPKAEPHHGYVLPCKLAFKDLAADGSVTTRSYEHMNVVLGINYQQLFYNPDLQAKLDMGLTALANHAAGCYKPIGSDLVKNLAYPKSMCEIDMALNGLLKKPALSVDIEGFSLDFDKAGIGTITFCWDTENGIVFPVDYMEVKSPLGLFGGPRKNVQIRGLLRQFFERYPGKIIMHNASYDAKVLIYYLWMKDLLDQKGLMKGLEVITRDLEDTKIIAYLATNTTAGNHLGLKSLAHEFAGNYAVEEISDIRKIPLPKLLQYNGVDGLSTQYVYKKYYPIMVQDQQEHLYRTLMMPTLKLLLQVELTGMPLSRTKVAEARKKLEAIRDQHRSEIDAHPLIQQLNEQLKRESWESDYEKRKAKSKTGKIKIKNYDDFPDHEFNPGSPDQVGVLLYDVMGLPVIDLTDTKKPATGGKTLKKLVNHTADSSHKALIESLRGYSKAVKILSTFIPAFENALDKGTGDIVWLHGNFNIGGTVSGRLSSSDPNMQNIPAGSTYGKLIKECFMAPEGWLFAGADFNSLEDYISALTTRDPNKLKVYIDGFDGHCLRAKSYFGDEMPDIGDTVDEINSIETKYPELRQKSKVPTFALTYQGTWHTLVANLGLAEEEAKKIEANYHELYKVSDEYVQKRLEQASKDGYVDVAFGLRVRTPMLAQVVWGGKMPYEAKKEGRTAGNALGQSYGLLNNRAAVAFMEKVWASPYRYDIQVVALIHDAIYLLIRNRLDVVEFANRELINAMRWQELPELEHDTVKLGAALDIFWPSWAHATTIPNDADQKTILEVCAKTKEEVLKKAA